MRVALIHDHLAQDGGAEKVLKVFADMFPDADIYTLLYEQKNANQYYKDRKIHTSVIQKLPGGVKHYQWYMPFMPMAVEFFDLYNYDLVLSDTSSFAKGVITNIDTTHICYCHTPTRYIWSDNQQYIKELKYNKYFKKIISLVLNYIRMWDRMAADRVDKYIANSHFIEKRIKKYYRRNSHVIYPPVDVDRFNVSNEIGDYFLVGGRLAPYKRIDVVIEAFNELSQKSKVHKVQSTKLKIFGDGVDMTRLEKLAKNNSGIEFLGRVSDEEIVGLYSKCLAFIHPQEEDFGITAVEAMASGRPVIAYKKGGAIETVVEGVTGLFFKSQDANALVGLIEKFNSNQFDSQKIHDHAQQFSIERFKKEITNFIKRECGK